jgi:hypothetical protein
MQTKTIDNQLIANNILGGVLGNRQDAAVGFDFEDLNLVQEQELELAA